MSTKSGTQPVFGMQQPSFTKSITAYVGRTAQRSGLFVAVAITGILLLALVALSPLALNQIGKLRGINWLQLSAIGQTYGATSALLTGLALLGVVGSILFQIRAIQASMDQSSREHHAHLVEIAMNDPVYIRAWGYDAALMTNDPDALRQNMYLNPIVSHWERDFTLGEDPEHTLRVGLAGLFGGEAGRKWWAEVRDVRLIAAKGRKGKRFIRVVDEEYKKAVGSGPPRVSARGSQNPANQRDWQRRTIQAQLITAAIGGAILGGTIGRIIPKK